jgi:hypothetical protein
MSQLLSLPYPRVVETKALKDSEKNRHPGGRVKWGRGDSSSLISVLGTGDLADFEG